MLGFIVVFSFSDDVDLVSAKRQNKIEIKVKIKVNFLLVID